MERTLLPDILTYVIHVIDKIIIPQAELMQLQAMELKLMRKKTTSL